MKKTILLLAEGMRWFGPQDSVQLAEILQTGATAAFSALHDIPYGEPWPTASIVTRRDEIAAAGLVWRVVESLPVHESIKTRTGDFARHIENYCVTLKRLGAAGISVVVYNFMPVMDWVRTDLRYRLPDGAEALLYDPRKLAAFDLFALRRTAAHAEYSRGQVQAAKQFWYQQTEDERAAFIRQTLDLFPGVQLGLTLDDLRQMLAAYAGIDAQKLREHLARFLEAVVPVAESAGVRLAIHPDDPPFPVLGLPRVVSNEDDLHEILAMVDCRTNGLCFCSGSLGARADNDLAGIVQRLGPRIHAAHLRSVQREATGVFYEANHLEGCADMPGVVLALLQEQYARLEQQRDDWQIALRPDHGHMRLDDFRRAAPTCPGYSLIGRLRGLAELRGLQTGIATMLAHPLASATTGLRPSPTEKPDKRQHDRC